MADQGILPVDLQHPPETIYNDRRPNLDGRYKASTLASMSSAPGDRQPESTQPLPLDLTVGCGKTDRLYEIRVKGESPSVSREALV